MRASCTFELNCLIVFTVQVFLKIILQKYGLYDCALALEGTGENVKEILIIMVLVAVTSDGSCMFL